MFIDAPIEGVVVRELTRHEDARGWLVELFRSDELPSSLHPAMAYVSETLPGIVRGPHEHADQTDHFVFAGPGDFRVVLWDARANSPTKGHRQVLVVGASRRAAVIVPAGVVHAYEAIGTTPGWVLNFPNRLYGGEGRRQAVDEVRHELEPGNRYVADMAALNASSNSQ